jgi:outer membrane protein TolC
LIAPLIAGLALSASGAPAQSQSPYGVVPVIPNVPADRAIGIQEAIQISFQNQASIAVAEESLEAARMRVRQARVGIIPNVQASVGYRGSGTSAVGNVFGGQRTREGSRFDMGLQPVFDLNYTVYDGGATRQSVRQARAGVESSQAGLAGARNNLAFNVTSNYLLQLRSHQLLKLRQVQVELAEEQLRNVKARIDAGSAARTDSALTESELQNRRVDLRVAENNYQIDANELRNSMGLYVGPPLKLIEVAESREPLLPLDSLLEVAMRQRPEVAQADAQARSAKAIQSLRRIDRKPRLNTSFNFSLTPNNTFQRSDFAVGAAISMPLWDAGLTQAREREAKTQVQSTLAQLEQTRKNVSSDVQTAYLNLVSSRDRLAVSRTAVDAAQVNVQAAQERYLRGVAGTTVIDLIQAQTQFATANNNSIFALYDIHLAQAQLNRATGKY